MSSPSVFEHAAQAHHERVALGQADGRADGEQAVGLLVGVGVEFGPQGDALAGVHVDDHDGGIGGQRGADVGPRRQVRQLGVEFRQVGEDRGVGAEPVVAVPLVRGRWSRRRRWRACRGQGDAQAGVGGGVLHGVGSCWGRAAGSGWCRAGRQVPHRAVRRRPAAAARRWPRRPRSARCRGPCGGGRGVSSTAVSGGAAVMSGADVSAGASVSPPSSLHAASSRPTPASVAMIRFAAPVFSSDVDSTGGTSATRGPLRKGCRASTWSDGTEFLTQTAGPGRQVGYRSV